jgi:hypothetical protein
VSTGDWIIRVFAFLGTVAILVQIIHYFSWDRHRAIAEQTPLSEREYRITYDIKKELYFPQWRHKNGTDGWYTAFRWVRSSDGSGPDPEYCGYKTAVEASKKAIELWGGGILKVEKGTAEER